MLVPGIYAPVKMSRIMVDVLAGKWKQLWLFWLPKPKLQRLKIRMDRMVDGGCFDNIRFSAYLT